MPINRIAFSTGYRSVRTFQIVFRHQMGESPRAYRGKGAEPKVPSHDND
jgi:transcriptional regulator GlxA family with amidase domain